jgi:predicted MFS family arabinose efflux permease
MADAARPKPTITRAEWVLLALLAAVQFTNVLDFVIVMPLAPAMTAAAAEGGLGLTTDQFGHIVAAYGFGSFFGSLLAAKFLERFGRKTVLLTVYFGFTVATLLCGLTGEYALLVACRALAGVFGGVVGVSVLAIVGDVFADYRRGTATGVVMSSFAVATIVGVPLGLGIAEEFGTLIPFVALAGLSAVVWLAAAFVMPSLPGHPERRASSLVALATEPTHILAYLFTTALVLGSFTVVPYIAVSMVRNAGQKPEHVKYVYMVAGLFTFVSMNVIGRLSDRYGKKLMFRLMGTLAILSALAITNLPVVSVWVAGLVATVFMVTTSGRMVPGQALITASAAATARGGFLSLNGAVQAMGMGLASLIGGALIGQQTDGRLDGYPLVGLVSAGSAVVSLILVGLLRSGEGKPTPIPAAPATPVAAAEAA